MNGRLRTYVGNRTQWGYWGGQALQLAQSDVRFVNFPTSENMIFKTEESYIGRGCQHTKNIERNFVKWGNNLF